MSSPTTVRWSNVAHGHSSYGYPGYLDRAISIANDLVLRESGDLSHPLDDVQKALRILRAHRRYPGLVTKLETVLATFQRRGQR